MITDCPDPKEVADFHFLQLRTIRIIKGNENVPSKSVNALASSSKYGLLFIGIEGGFKVMNLEDVLTLDEDKENRNIEENYPCSFVPCGTPVMLAVNANQMTLAVCVKSISDIVIKFYNLQSFPSSDVVWQPLCSNTLSVSGIELQDFVWNPAVEGLYAFCLSDGSLHIHELLGSSIKHVANLQSANAISVCWSPKGKQLVVGKQNGSFTQYKPSLQEVKTVEAPALDESPVVVTSICWISNTVFAVIYVADDTPNLFIVSTPKDSAAVYTNFSDVCLGNNSSSDQKYFLHLESSWGILICASLDSIEIAVLGDMPNWVQWDLKEDGKALLPGKDGATHAVGMTVMYSAQRQIIISESESYPPMPVMFLLTNNGLLVSFHMINAKSGAAALVSPPLPLEFNTEKSFVTFDAVQGIEKQLLPSSNQHVLTPTFAGNTAVNQIPALQNRESQNANIAASTYGMIKSSTFSLADKQEETSNLFGSETFVKSLNKSMGDQLDPNQEIQDKIPKKGSPFISVSEKLNEVQSSTENSYIMAIISEIQSFTKELQDLKQLQSSSPTVHGEEDMISLKIFALNMHNFQKDISETMQSISSDIYTLKNVLLESFVMVEEACSRERRRNDHSYITMLKERALDPITAKRMQKMNQHYQYLTTQLQEVSDKLDQDWINLLSNKTKSVRSNPCISSTEAIYKTIVNNQKIIHNLRKKIDVLLKEAEVKKLRNITKSGTWGKYKRSTQEDLSKLADEFLQVKIAYHEGEPPVTKKLSTESQNFLKTFLKESNVITVRPTTVYSPFQSRLLSNAVPSEDFSVNDQEKNFPSKQASTPPPYEKGTSKVIPSTMEVQSPNISSKMSLQESSPNEFIAQPCVPIYEPITPPDAVNASQPTDKTFITNDTPITPAKDNYPEPHAVHPSLRMVTNTASSPILPKDSVDQEFSILNSVKSSKELPIVSFSIGAKPQATSETTCSISNSLTFPKTVSLTTCIQKSPEYIASECVTNSSIASTTLPNFQFGQRNDTLWSIPAVTSLPLVQESKSLNVLESSQVSQQQIPVSNNTLSMTSNQNVNATLSVTETSQVSSTLPTASANKSTYLHIPGDKMHSDTPQTFLLFQKPSDNSNQSILGKGENPLTSSGPSEENLHFTLDLVNKNVSLVSESPGGQEVSTDIEKSVSSTLTDSIISSNSATLQSILKTNALANIQPDINSDLSNLKTSTPSSNVQPPKPSVISSSVAEMKAVINTTAQPTSIVTVVTVSSSLSGTNTVSKSSTPAVSSLSPETTPVPTVGLLENISVCSPTSSDGIKKTESSVISPFGMNSTLFRQSTSEPSFFHTTMATCTTTANTTSVASAAAAATTTTVPTTESSAFNRTSITQTTSFGQPTSSSNFPSASGGFFSQTPVFGASTTTPATTTAVTTTANLDINNQASTFSFGKPAFGQATGSFGLAKSFFGQNTTSFTQSGTSSNFTFGQSSNNIFGQGSFFSGLGGTPSEENASKNVFGVSSGVKSADTSNLFRNTGVTSFGAVNSGSFSGPGSFSSGGGSVAQSGFGSFQQSSVQQPGFGSAPAFGSAPTFGSAPAFGASPTFGSGNSLAAIFGQQQMSSNFSNFANASSPTFGSLASQSSGFGSPSGGFGSQGSSAFGSSAFGASSFGGQSPGFGSPSSPPNNSSAFTQWRN